MTRTLAVPSHQHSTWSLYHEFQTKAEPEDVSVDPNLQRLALNQYQGVRIIELEPLWQDPSLDPTPVLTRLPHGSGENPPVQVLTSGKIAVHHSSKWLIHDPSTDDPPLELEGKLPSPCGTMTASVVHHTSREYAGGSSWDSYSRDGDDMSERTIVHYDGVSVRGRVLWMFPCTGDYGLTWAGSNKLVAWQNQVIHLCDLQDRSVTELLRCSWVIRGPAVSPNGQWLVAEPPWGAVTLWNLREGTPGVEIPHLRRQELLAVTDAGVVIVTAPTERLVELWDHVAGGALPQFSNEHATRWRAFNADASRLVAVTDDTVQMWRRG